MRTSLPAVLLTLFAGAAHAHDADVIYVELVEGQGGSLVERITMTASTLQQLAPVDADGDGKLTQQDLDARADAIRLGVWEQAQLQPCQRSHEAARFDPSYVELTADFTCGPGELTQEFRWLMVLPSNYRVLLGSQLKGEAAATAAAQGAMRTLHVPRPTAVGRGFLVPVVPAIGAALALVAFALRRRRIALGLFLFALGFVLVERLLA